VGLEAFLANRGIPLDKGGGAVRPIGVGELLRRIIGKAVLGVVGPDVQRAAGPLQLCAGEAAGVEAGIHAMRELFGELDNDGVFMIDAANAFNRVNRAVVLWNVQFLCPPLKYILINTYRSPNRILVCDNTGKFQEFSSREGTTQGCPLAMAMYAIALIPLIKELKPLSKQVWYADDATGVDTIENLKVWFDKLLERGPLYGYFPQPKKCVLIVREEPVEGAGVFLTDLERAIRQEFIPALLGRNISDHERELFSVPARFGGLGISNPCTKASMTLDFLGSLCLSTTPSSRQFRSH